MGQDPGMQIIKGQKDGAGARLVKGLQAAVPEPGRTSTLKGLEDQMPLPHLLATLQEKNAEPLGLSGPPAEEQANLNQKTVYLGSQPRR
jgi:hypothetical protein